MPACTQIFPPLSGDTEKIRLMQPEDVPGVAELMREVYGDTYPEKFVYDPALLKKKIANGEITPAVAAGPAGKIVGYRTLATYYGYPDIGLVGSLTVSPACRGREIGRKLGRYLIAAGESAGFQTLTAGTFTTHPFSQNVAEREGFCPSAVLLGSQSQETPGQRESVVFYTRVLVPEDYGIQYLPASHRLVIREICRDLGILIYAEGTGLYPVGAPSVMESALNMDTGAGLIWMRKAGYDYHEVLGSAVRKLRAGGAKVLRLHLNLNDPGSPAVVRAAEETGFIFAGILPAKDGLVLLMQNVQDIAVDPDKIFLGDNPAARRLLGYIALQIENTRHNACEGPQEA